MEKIENSKMLFSINKTQRQKYKQQVERSLQVLHSAQFVHGDFRDSNILVTEDRVYVIDFDWSGIVGQTFYPYFMNHDIPWPEGAADGLLITTDHDSWWFQQHFID